jgi:hypothetical protein
VIASLGFTEIEYRFAGHIHHWDYQEGRAADGSCVPWAGVIVPTPTTTSLASPSPRPPPWAASRSPRLADSVAAPTPLAHDDLWQGDPHRRAAEAFTWPVLAPRLDAPLGVVVGAGAAYTAEARRRRGAQGAVADSAGRGSRGLNREWTRMDDGIHANG